MSLRIVHLLSQTHLTGAEAHAVTLAEGLQARGHSVTIVSDRLHLGTRAAFIARPIHAARGLARWREIFWLRAYLQKENTDVVHAHSRAAVRIAWWATRGLPTALVSTVHGRQHFSWGKRLFDRYGERVVAVCENLKKHLVRDFGMRDSRIAVIGNPVELPAPRAKTQTAHWLMVTRWTGPKGRRAVEMMTHVLPTLFSENPDLKLDLCGVPPDDGSAAVRALRDLQSKFPGRVVHRGLLDPLEEHLTAYDLILGGGRVAIAAIGAGRPCFAFGEASTIGLVRDDVWEAALASNFGDIEPDAVDEALDHGLALRELRGFLGTSDIDAEGLAARARPLFDAGAVTERIVQVYRSARLLKKHPHPIPVLMYHMVVPEPIETPHRIFVTAETLRNHLSLFQKRGLRTLGFHDLLDFKEGRRPLADFPRRPLILTFDDGYENNLTLAAPLLGEFGMKAVIYLLADSSLRANQWDEGASPRIPLMTPEQRRRLAATGVFEIASHGFRHARLPGMTEAEALIELRDSKAALENEFGRKVKSFAFTYGDIDGRSPDLARRAGYDYAVNTDRGAVLLEENPWSVFRANVFPEDRGWRILKKASPWYRWRYFKTRGF